MVTKRADISDEEFERQLANAPAPVKVGVEPRRQPALAWLALAPAWPEQLAIAGFPLDDDGALATGDAVVALLREFASADRLRSGPGESPLESRWYWMDRRQRAVVLRGYLEGEGFGLEYLSAQLRRAANQMKAAAADRPLNRSFERWLQLSLAGPPSAMAPMVEREVAAALAGADMSGDFACPEAQRWIEAAQLLAELFGGTLEVAVARAQRRMEIFRRNSRDNRHLLNFFKRPDLLKPFNKLLQESSKKSWALHYVGEGGIGKTMLIRSIRTQLAPSKKLAVGHVDFDHLNPDYPRRAPGLLLMGFAEDLRLDDNPSVVAAFASFDDEIRKVHGRLQGAFAASLNLAAEGYMPRIDTAIEFFIEALRLIVRRGMRPLLILDTCEELARIRADKQLPENVAVTFDLLARIQKSVPELRVIFSGRRPLARRGMNWEWAGCELPDREHLRLQPVLPFDEQEALDFLGQYKRQGRVVPAGIRAIILQYSDIDHNPPPGSRRRNAPAFSALAWKSGGPAASLSGKQYYPYDLDLYASWATSEEGLDAQKLKTAHYYVEDRIINRVGDLLRRWLPDLALLGRFDRPMLEQLTGTYGAAFDSLWTDIVQQEWTEVDRNAQRDEVWAVEPRLRGRLLAYYRDQKGEPVQASANRVRDLLENVTLARRFEDLTPAYFEAYLEVGTADPERAARWWQSVEQKIAGAGRWDWGKQITELLLEDESVAGPVDPAAGGAAHPECVLRPAILATHAAVHIHVSNAAVNVETAWSEVLAKFERHPVEAGRQRLHYRAMAGLEACRHYSRQNADGEDFRETLARFRNALAQQPSPPDDADRASELAMFEGLTEYLERYARADPKVVSEFRSLLTKPPDTAPEAFRTFHMALDGRMRLLEGDAAEAARLLRQAASNPTPGNYNQCWPDWRMPDDLQARMALELARVQDPGALYVKASQATVDSDRWGAARLMWESSRRFPVTFVFENSFSYRPEIHLPQSNAHRAFPPYFAIAIELMAAKGEVDKAVRRAIEISSNQQLPLEVRREADRAGLRIVSRMLLFEEKIGLQSSLTDSPLPADQQLVATVRLLRENPNKAPERARFIQELSVQVPDSQPRRRAGNCFLRALLCPDAAGKLSSFDEARRNYELAGDELGKVLSLIGHATAGCTLPLSRNKLLADLQGVFASQVLPLPSVAAEERAAARAANVQANNSRPAIGASGVEWTKYLDAIPREWRPWMVRLAACAIRSQEFERPGERTAHFLTWLNSTYGSGPPQPVLKALAQPGFVAKTLAKTRPLIPVLRQVIVVLLALALLFVLAVLTYRLYSAGLHKLGVQWGTTATVLSLLGAIAVIIAGGAALPAAVRAYVSLMARAMMIEYRFLPRGEITDPNDPMTVRWALTSRIVFRFPLPRAWVARFREGREISATGFSATYAGQAGALTNSKTNWFINWTLRVFLTTGAYLDVVFYLDEAASAAPWEAVIGLFQSPIGLNNLKFRFRRTSRVARESNNWMLAPKRGRAAVVTLASDTGASRYAPSAWARRTAHYPFTHTLQDPAHRSGPLVPDPDIYIVHVVGKPVDTSAGLRIRLVNQGEGSEMKSDEISAAMPGLRVCILQDFPVEPRERTLTDRYAANIARRFAFQLHSAGVPAVIVLPPLPEVLVQWAIILLADTLAETPAFGTAALGVAVQSIRERIALEAKPDSATATEMAIDVCFYALASINLDVEPAGSEAGLPE